MILSTTAFAFSGDTTLSDEALAFFGEQEVLVSDNATLALVPVEKHGANQTDSLTKATKTENEAGYALQLIEQGNNEVLVHSFLFLKENEDGEYTIDSERAESILRSDNPNPGGSAPLGSITVQATVSYGTYIIPATATAYRPTGLTWAYSGSSTGVSYINVECSTSGTAFNYTTYAKIQDGYLHQMRCSVSAPLANQPYSNYNNPCPYAVDLAPGGGMTVDFYATINGRSYFYNL